VQGTGVTDHVDIAAVTRSDHSRVVGWIVEFGDPRVLINSVAATKRAPNGQDRVSWPHHSLIDDPVLAALVAQAIQRYQLIDHAAIGRRSATRLPTCDQYLHFIPTGFDRGPIAYGVPQQLVGPGGAVTV